MAAMRTAREVVELYNLVVWKMFNGYQQGVWN